MPPEPADPLGDLVPERLRDAPLWERVLCLAGGLFFLLLGVVGWLLPVVTGIPFYVIGLFLLAGVAPPARHFVNWLDRKLPMGARRLLRKVRRAKPPTDAPGSGGEAPPR